MTRNAYQRVFCMLILGPILLGNHAVMGAEQSPLGVIQSGTRQVLQILRSSQVIAGLPSSQQRDEIVRVVADYLDFEEMSRRALGYHWERQSEAKRQEFIQLFKKLFYNTYLDRFDLTDYSNEDVTFDGETVEGHYAVVKTHIVGAGFQRVSVDYRLRMADQQWKVYDVIVEGISFVSNYRSQFNSLLTRGSFDDLLKRLQEKISANWRQMPATRYQSFPA